MGKARRTYRTLNEYLSATATSQVAFARALDVQQSAVSQWVTGLRVPRPELALKIHKKTGIALEGLLNKKKK